MLVVMQQDATEAQIQRRHRPVGGDGLHRAPLDRRAAHGAGRRRRPVDQIDPADFRSDGRREGMPPHRFAVQAGKPRSFRPQGTVVKNRQGRNRRPESGGDGRAVQRGERGADRGRCAEIVAEGGAQVLRGGAFKPRSSPYSFQGMGEDGLQMMRAAADRHGLLMVSEVMDPPQIPLLVQYSDILQIGARNMQNFNLLRELGQCQQAGAAEARDRGHHRRAAAGGRIHHERRQLRRDLVRARHPHV